MPSAFRPFSEIELFKKWRVNKLISDYDVEELSATGFKGNRANVAAPVRINETQLPTRILRVKALAYRHDCSIRQDMFTN